MCCMPDQFDWENNKYAEVQEVCKISFSKNVFVDFADVKKDEPIEFVLLRVRGKVDYQAEGPEDVEEKEFKYTMLDENGVDVCDYMGEYYETFGEALDVFMNFDFSIITKEIRDKR